MTKKRLGRPIDTSKDKAIIDAARELLLESGPVAITMESVAEKAGVSKGTLYSRYSNRHDLLKVIIDNRSNDLITPIETIPNTKKELEKALTDFVEKLIIFLVSDEHLRLMEIMTSSSVVMLREKRNIYLNGPQQMHDGLTSYLQMADTKGIICCKEPADSAEMLLGMMMGLDLVRAWYGVPLKLSENHKFNQYAHKIVTIFLSLLEPESTGS